MPSFRLDYAAAGALDTPPGWACTSLRETMSKWHASLRIVLEANGLSQGLAEAFRARKELTGSALELAAVSIAGLRSRAVGCLHNVSTPPPRMLNARLGY